MGSPTSWSARCAAGHDVEVAGDGVEGERRALESDLDLVILDVMLPGRNGLEVLRGDPAVKPALPVIMLTARSRGRRQGRGPRRRRDGLHHQAVLGRGAAGPRARASAHPAAGSRTRRTMRRGDRDGPAAPDGDARREPVHLSAKEFDLLAYFMRHPGPGAVARADAERRLGTTTTTRRRTSSRSTSAICAASSRSPSVPAPIETVRSVGYRFVDAVTRLRGPAPAGHAADRRGRGRLRRDRLRRRVRRDRDASCRRARDQDLRSDMARSSRRSGRLARRRGDRRAGPRLPPHASRSAPPATCSSCRRRAGAPVTNQPELARARADRRQRERGPAGAREPRAARASSPRRPASAVQSCRTSAACGSSSATARRAGERRAGRGRGADRADRPRQAGRARRVPPRRRAGRARPRWRAASRSPRASPRRCGGWRASPRAVDGGDLGPRMEIGDRQRRGPRAGARRSTTCSTASRTRSTARRAFVADASHELRTPLTVIRGQLEVLALAERPDRPRRCGASRSSCALEIERMSRLVEDMLAARPGRRGRVPAPVGHRAAPVRHRPRPRARGRGAAAPRARARSRRCSSRPTRTAWRRRCATCCATRSRTPPRTGAVALGVESADGRVRFIVDDDGPGHPGRPARRGLRPLPPPRRRPRPRRRRAPGSGSRSSQAIADAHGGRIEIADSPAGGARVSLVLPLVPAAVSRRRPR